MKKFIALAAVALLGISCSDDDSSETNGGTVDVAATWKLTSVTTDEPLDINEDGNATTDFIAETGCFDNTTLVLAENNTAIYTVQAYFLECFEYTQTGTWTQSGNDVTVVMGEGEDQITTDFTINGNTITYYDSEWYEVEVNGEVQSSIPATLVFTKQ